MPSLDRHVRGWRQAARLDASVYPRQTGVPVIQACPPSAYSRPRPPLVESVLRRPVHRRFVPALRSANPDGRRRCNLWFREFRVRAGDSPGRRRCRAEDSPYGRAYRLGCWARRQPAVAVSAAEFAGQFPSQNRPMNFRRLSFRVTGIAVSLSRLHKQEAGALFPIRIAGDTRASETRAWAAQSGRPNPVCKDPLIGLRVAFVTKQR